MMKNSLPFRLHAKGLTVSIRLSPGAKVSAVTGLMDVGEEETVLKVSVNAPPEDGRANKELIALLAKEWGLPKNIFSLLSGETNRRKVLLLAGDGRSLMQRLLRWLEERFTSGKKCD